MRVDLPYGRGRLAVELPGGRTDVVVPRDIEPAADPAALLRRALAEPTATGPLRETVGPSSTVAISVCDHTRPQPRIAMLEALLDQLTVVPDGQITILIATGTHRASNDGELAEMLGPLRHRFRVVNHDCLDPTHVPLGTVRGSTGGPVDVSINRHWVQADVRITTGFVEPHFFAGFSGGPKLVAPGLAALHTVQALHNVERIADPRAIWGMIDGNPVHDAIRAAAALAPPTLAFDVLLDRHHRITHAYAGELTSTHALACARAREVAMSPVAAPYGVVVTTNAGYPLDQNLYQAVKGMRSAAQIAAPGGLIVCVAECSDGIPDGSPFASQLLQGRSARQVLADLSASAEPLPEQWQLQVLAQLQLAHRVGVHCDGIDADTLRRCNLEPVADVAAAVHEVLAADPRARVCVLPNGAETIPYVSAGDAVSPSR